jgi:hypothetical protein
MKGGESLGRLLPLQTRVPGSRPTAEPATNTAPIQIVIGPYLGWERALTLGNGRVEAVVVPAIGRIMQFRRVGKATPFWEDPALRGKAPDPGSSEWGNFGGDKTWPAPQGEWDRQAGRAWPPPAAFDSMPVEAFVRRDTVVLVSPVDRHYGIRTERVISLPHDAPEMQVVTTYEKISGDPVRVGVWIITQLGDPVGVYAPIPAPTRFPEGFNRQSGDVLPAGLRVEGRLLSLRRDPRKSTKIGTDTDRLLWVGPEEMLLIESPRVAGGEYPDQQSSAEVYTNPDPKTYVELEMLGPLHDLKPGDRLSQTNTYRLLPRESPDPAADARRVLLAR